VLDGAGWLVLVETHLTLTLPPLRGSLPLLMGEGMVATFPLSLREREGPARRSRVGG
jgi:hypothetical protein